MTSPRQVVITGASSGFGRLMTERFLADGWIVHATSRRGVLEYTSTLPSDLQQNLNVYELDLENRESLNTFSTRITKLVPRLDVLINNAGFGLFGALEDLTEEQIHKQMTVNFFGPTLLTRSLLPSLRSARGHIICFSSLLGFSGLPLTSLYCASKFALEGLAEALKYELSPHGVNVTVVQPGAHRTNFGFNVEWGQKSFDTASAFSLQSRNYRQLLEKMRTRPHFARPEAVADRVCKIAGTKKPPFRLQIGKDVRATSLLRRLLPFKLFLSLSDRLYRKIFTSPLEKLA